MVAVYRLVAHRLGYHARSYICHDARGHYDGFVDGASVQSRLYAWRSGFPALLRFPFAFYILYVGIGRSHKYFPDVHLLGTCGCIVLFAHRFLLYSPVGGCRFQESFHRYPFCRSRLSAGYLVAFVLYQDFRLCDIDKRRSFAGRYDRRKNIPRYLGRFLGYDIGIYGWCR